MRSYGHNITALIFALAKEPDSVLGLGLGEGSLNGSIHDVGLLGGIYSSVDPSLLVVVHQWLGGFVVGLHTLLESLWVVV